MIPKKNNFSNLSPVCILILAISISKCVADDVYCLESIKQSLEDPDGMLSSWDFTNKKDPSFICSFIGVECWNSEENRVMNLVLGDMRLKGNFPQGLQHCTSLVTLQLNGNQLTGTIPSHLCVMVGYLTVLDLSKNSFTGEIPESIGDCVYLNRLSLNSNQLTGRIPVEAIGRLTRLSYLNVADNELEGPVPLGVTVRSDNYANNKGLCGGPLEPCKQQQEGKVEENHEPSMFIIGLATGWVFSAIFYAFTLVFFQSPQMVVTHLANYAQFIWLKYGF
ncbi:inactive LRR receptor-like serine/threonine-protein kinase BIR2 [Benincasa hispida]|uniref:inactive LRR receptor-like serine/threonine-protein kinase BIR2 n=1 Tax=Benincasa hispida TaxID=102211 RepID=UPI0019009415|nr:inactive LRR receptor-like serine/threonine-protein kinase BIR2 [Benincasa hispida]